MFLGQAPRHVRAASLWSPQVCLSLSDCVGQYVNVCDFPKNIDLAQNLALQLPPLCLAAYLVLSVFSVSWSVCPTSLRDLFCIYIFINPTPSISFPLHWALRQVVTAVCLACKVMQKVMTCACVRVGWLMSGWFQLIIPDVLRRACLLSEPEHSPHWTLIEEGIISAGNSEKERNDLTGPFRSFTSR